MLPPENATGNFAKSSRRVPVKIVFDEPPDPRLSARTRDVGRADRASQIGMP